MEMNNLSEVDKADVEEITSSRALTIKLPDESYLVKMLERDKRWIGRTLLFGYYKHNPLFTIGPHCTSI